MCHLISFNKWLPPKALPRYQTLLSFGKFPSCVFLVKPCPLPEATIVLIFCHPTINLCILECHRNKIMQYIFLVRLLRFCVSRIWSFFLSQEYVKSLSSRWITGSFPFWGHYEKSCHECSYTSLFVYICFHFSWVNAKRNVS